MRINANLSRVRRAEILRDIARYLCKHNPQSNLAYLLQQVVELRSEASALLEKCQHSTLTNKAAWLAKYTKDSERIFECWSEMNSLQCNSILKASVPPSVAPARARRM